VATLQSQLVCDNSTLANFKQWAQAISAALSTFGWVQSSDTGQVNWGSIGAVPGSGAYVYEIWQPNDGLTNFYMKVEYGNSSGTNSPGLRITLSTATNGAGTPTGFITSVIQTTNQPITVPSTTTQYECNFSGVAGRFGVMMWRNAPVGSNSPQQFFAVERSVNSSGAYTSSYVTLWTLGAISTGRNQQQQSLVFGIGPSVLLPQTVTNNGWVYRLAQIGASASAAFNGMIPFDTCAPMVGYIDYNCTVIGGSCQLDIVEGVQFTATLYGSTRTFMPSKQGVFGTSNGTMAMRYD
jgi:hypothetical protein